MITQIIPIIPKTVKTGSYKYGDWTIQRMADNGNVQLYRRTFEPDLGAPLRPAEFSMCAGGEYRRIGRKAYRSLYAAIVLDDAAYERWLDVEDTRDDFLAMTR